MFGRKRRKSQPHIVVWDADRAVLADCALMELPIPESAVIALSVAFFNDPSPCEIHRGAVRWRATQELLEVSKGKEVSVEGLNPNILQALPDAASSYIVREVDV